MEIIKENKFDSVGYFGRVEVGIEKDGRKFKRFTANTGTIDLFKYLCGCLSGEINPNYSTGLRPGALRLYAGASPTTSILSVGIPVSGVVITPYTETDGTGAINEAESACSITYNFLIPGTSLYNRKVFKVRLTPLSDTKPSGGAEPVYYAEAKFDVPIVINDLDTNLYVSWTLTVKNEKK